MNEIKGLIYKDWSIMARQLKLMILYILIFVVVFSFTLSESSFMSSFFSLLVFMMSINCFAYDEQVHFDKLIAASPLSPIKVVLSRYIAALSLGFLGGIAIYLINIVIFVIRKSPKESFITSLLSLAGAVSVAILLVSVLFPFIYKFGVNKSRMIIILICAVPALGFMLLSSILPKNTFSHISIPSGLLNALPYILPVLLFAALVISIISSKRILCYKEY